jgi:hypothetical protein
MLAERLGKMWRAYSDARLLVRDHRKPAPLFFHSFVGKTNGNRIIIHSAVAFGLFAGCCLWIVTHYVEIHKPLSYVLLFGACGISVSYLLVVWALTKNRK